jgi:dihydrofolate reductase
MRRIVAFDRVTADGYFAAPDGGLNWVMHDEDLDAEVSSAIGGRRDQPPASAGTRNTLLFGRRTYDQFESFWPRALDESETSPDPHGGRRSSAMRAMAVWLNEAHKIVFSRTRTDVTWAHSRLEPALDPRQIESMKTEPGLDIMIFGSGSIVSALTAHDLIDEYQFIVNPILIGDGQSLIRGVQTARPLTLLEAKSYRSGIVKLRYARAG